MRKSWRLIISVLVFLAIIILIFAFKSFFQTYFIEPITRIFWPFFRLLQAIDQKVFWILLILLAAILIFWLISNEKGDEHRSAYLDFSQSENRVIFWENLIQSARKNKNERIVLERKLEELSNAISICMNEPQADKVDPRQYIHPKEKIRFARGNSSIIKQFLSHFTKTADFENSLNHSLAQMETKMEITNDQSSSKSHEG